MTILFILLYILGFVIVWKIDRKSFRRSENANLPENIRKRIIISLFSWVILLPLLGISLYAWYFNRNDI